MYPENTLLAFKKAMELEGLEGSELDIQLTKDGQLVVCHDERVDRTTDGIGEVRQFTLTEIKKLLIEAGNGRYEQIPLMEEVLELFRSGKKLKDNLKLNIELKNSVFPYEGMEEKLIDLIHKNGLQDRVVYSSFSALSLEKNRLDLAALEQRGITDVFLNEPEKYV